MSKYYAVLKGRTTGIFTDWETTKNSVTGYPGAIHKSFKTLQEAQQFLGIPITASNSNVTSVPNIPVIPSNSSVPVIPSVPNIPVIPVIPGNSNIPVIPSNSNIQVNYNELIIYTDGSHTQERGGIGIAFINGGQIIKQVSEKMTEFPTTNIRAELFAILRALQIIHEYAVQGSISIYTDSEHSVNVFNKWIYQWIRNNWKTSTGKSPENLDLIINIWELLTQHRNVSLKWVKGHATDPYNNLVDQLAKRGRDSYS